MTESAKRDARIASADELDAFLARYPDLDYVQLVLTDVKGIARGKNLAREELATFYTDGRNVAGSILGLDITGEDVVETGLVWEVGDADQLCRPVGGTLTPAPWLARPAAQVVASVFEPDGRPAAADPRHALARVVARARGLGYVPVVAAELCPVAPTWGINNRTVSLRVPAGAPASRHVEHRLAGADANPYLVAAVVLAGMLDGIERGLDPGPAVEGNGYAQAGPGVLPMHWPEALELAARSVFLADALGADLLRIFLAIKRQECARFAALVSNRDYEWYLDSV